jgi:hypothetical protein
VPSAVVIVPTWCSLLMALIRARGPPSLVGAGRRSHPPLASATGQSSRRPGWRLRRGLRRPDPSRSGSPSTGLTSPRTVVPHRLGHEGHAGHAGPAAKQPSRPDQPQPRADTQAAGRPRLLAGRSITGSSRTTTRSPRNCRAPCGRLPTRQVVVGDGPHPPVQLCDHRRHAGARLVLTAVPSACP